MEEKVLKVVSIGGFGHTVCVYDDMMGFDKARLVGAAPAFEGEDISFNINHDLVTDDVKIYDDYKKMLAEVKPDVAIISTRLDVIPTVTIDAANAGCHLICEKPLAIDVATLEKVYEAVKSNNVKLTAMLTMRSENIFRAARKLYESGAIGEAVLCNGRKSYKYGTRPEWFGDRKLYGGTVAWIGIHAFDFINYITGLKFTNVAAMGGNFAHPERPECYDNVALCSTMSNGGHATVSVDYLRPMESKTHGDDWVRVVGTKGVIESRGSNLTCTLHTAEAPVEVDLPQKSRMFREFMLSILGECEYEFEQEVSFELTHVCLCAEKSIDSGKVEQVEQGKWK
jgi:predicted dehydrogenase